jgi:hypothetical protein
MRVGVFPVAERASCESERGRGALLYETGRGRGSPVVGASYESELERGRGTPSSWPRTRRTRYAVEVGCLLLWLNYFVFYYRWLWVPHVVGTDSYGDAYLPIPLCILLPLFNVKLHSLIC